MDVALAPLAWNLAAAALTVGAVMLVTFTVATRIGVHSIVDVVWGLGFVAIAALGFALSRPYGDPGRRGLVLLLTALWGLRLAVYIGARNRGRGEDPRYARLLRKASGSPARFAVTTVYLPQGLVMWTVSLPVQVAMYERAALGATALAGTIVWTVGLAFEATADWQLARFKADPANAGLVLDCGVWRWSRHPNYFGDVCVWWGLFLVACDAWIGVVTIVAPLLMTHLLVNRTGKALLERHMARSRGPAYADYVARTSGFFPLPPKRT